MRLVAAVLAACCLAAAEAAPPGVIQLANIDSIVGFPEEFEARAFATDSRGAVYIAGTLESVPAGATAEFTTGEFHEANILVVKMDDALARVLYKVVIGGSGTEILYAMAVTEAGEVYLSGITRSKDFPATAKLDQPPSTADDQQAFVVKLNAAGEQIVYSALLGGGVKPTAIAVDAGGAALIAGNAEASSMPTTPGVQNPFPPPHGTGAFLAKLNAAGDQIAFAAAYNIPEITALSVLADGNLLFASSAFLKIVTRGASNEITSTPINVDEPTLSRDDAGNIYVAGRQRFQPQLLVQKYSPDGKRLLLERSIPGELNLQGRTPLAIGIGGRMHLFHQQATNLPTLNTVEPCMANLPPPAGYAGSVRSGTPAEGVHTVLGPDGATLWATFTADVEGAAMAGGSAEILALQRRLVWTQGVPLGKPSFRVVRIDPGFIGEERQYIGCTGHGATFTPMPLSPGALMLLFGGRLGPDAGVLFEAADGRVPYETGGTTVTVDGEPAPVVYAQDRQVNFLTPWTVRTGGELVPVCIRYGGEESCVLMATAPAAPGFVRHGDASLVWHEDGALNSPDNRAAPGSVVSFVFTGAGKLAGAVEDGAFNGADFVPLEAQVSASFIQIAPCRFCGLTIIPVEVLEVGSAPYELLGVSRVKVRIPPGFNAGFSIALSLPGQPGASYTAYGGLWVVQ